MTRIRRHSALLIILTLFITLATIYSVVNPLFESPDEVWHYEYVRWLVEGNGLAHPDDVGHAPWHQEGSQPPLYYIAAAALTSFIPTDNAADVIRYNPHAAIGQPDAFGNKNMMAHGAADGWPWRGVTLAAHVARFFSIFLGALTVLATYGIAHTILSTHGITHSGLLERRAVAVAAASIVAFNPQFLFLSAAVNNDNLVTAVSALGMWMCVSMIANRRGMNYHAPMKASPTTGQLILLGLLVGIAALSKLSGLAVAGLAGLTLMILAWSGKNQLGRSLTDLIRWGVIVGIVAFIVAGWWYMRNWLLFGDPLALQAMFDILPRRANPPTLDELIARAEGVWRSLWAVFGWFNVVVDERLYLFYSALSIVGITGFLFGGIRQVVTRDRPQGINPQSSIVNRQLLLLLIWITVIFLSLLRWAQMRYPQGRLLFPAISAAAVVLGIGLMNWLPARWQRVGAWCVASMMFVIAATTPWVWINPVYAAVTTPANDIVPPNLTAVDFGEQVRLVGYDIAKDEARPGDTLDVALYWEAIQPMTTDYSVFVHLTDNYDILQAQRDSYPVLGNLPTREWQPGDLIVDHHRVRIPETAPTPARMRVDVGLYNFVTEERLFVATENIDSEGQTDRWTIGNIALLAPAGDGTLPNSIFVNFDDQIALVGYDFDRYVMQPGETLTLTLWWEALATPKMNYKVFTHLILPPEATWAQMDSDPRRGESPTSTWQPGQRIADEYTLTLPETAPPGTYFVEIGFYDPDTYSRLRVNFSDKGIVLGQVRVGAE